MFGEARNGTLGAVLAAGLVGGGLLPFPLLPGGNGGSTQAAPSAAQFRSMGSTHEANGTLRRGCHRYRYTYRVSPPSDQWSLETFLVGPHGAGLGSDDVISGADPRSGVKHWRICRSNTRPGRFTIKGKLTYNDYPDTYSGWISPSHFRLHRP